MPLRLVRLLIQAYASSRPILWLSVPALRECWRKVLISWHCQYSNGDQKCNQNQCGYGLGHGVTGELKKSSNTPTANELIDLRSDLAAAWILAFNSSGT